jgi:hypothetical protein
MGLTFSLRIKFFNLFCFFLKRGTKFVKTPLIMDYLKTKFTMKRQITILSLFLLIASSIVSCKKDDTSLKAQMIGKWKLNRIVTTGYTAEDTLKDPKKINGDVTYGTTSDYVDFKSNNDDQVELSLSGNRTIGTYLIIYSDQFSMDINDGMNYCKINSISTSQLQFTAKIDKTNVTKVYYLSK